MFLTADELAELTGRERYHAQIRWLRDQRWAFAVRADGRPVVKRTEADRHLDSGAPKRRARDDSEPDFTALDKAG